MEDGEEAERRRFVMSCLDALQPLDDGLVRLAAFPIFGAALVYLRKLEDRLQLDATEDDVRLAWDVVDRFTPVVEKALVVFGRQG